MIKTIGLIDYDAMRKKFYAHPNYDLGVIYAYFKNDKNINIRLIINPEYKNLKQYDKIYIFKESKELAHPIEYIEGYYKLPIEEYGPGFNDKPLRPFQLETRELAPDCSCYNNMILFSIAHPYNRYAWKISKRARGKSHQPLRLYEKFEGEDLKKDLPLQQFGMVYDDPVEIFNDKAKFDYFNSLVKQKHNLLFAKLLDISRINDTNILEQIIKERRFAHLRRHMVASDANKNLDWLVEKAKIPGYFKSMVHVSVELPLERGTEECFRFMLDMIRINRDKSIKLWLKPSGGHDQLRSFILAHYAFKYLSGTAWQSFYEYLVGVGYMALGVPKNLIKSGEDRFEYIFKTYKYPPMLIQLEEWLKLNPEYYECVFIGGKSDYVELRKKYFDKYNFGFKI